MMEAQEKNNKLLRAKATFDKVTSQNATNWKLVLFWLIIIELISSAFEYIFIGSPFSLENQIPNTVAVEFIVGIMIAGFVWACVYNFIFWNKTNFFYLVLFGMVGLYIIITHDVYFDFLLFNINPLHFLNIEFSFALVIELILKLIMTYLIYQLVISIKNSKSLD